MLKIILTVNNATNLATVQWDTEHTPGSINPVTSGGIYTYCETKFKAISDRIDNISGLIDNLDTPAELSKAIAKLQAKVDKYYSGYESLVYLEKTGDDGTWTSVVGQEYPAYQLVDADTDFFRFSEPFLPPSPPYAVYRCIEPSTCTVAFQGVDSYGSPRWDIKNTPGKFEFVRWENA